VAEVVVRLVDELPVVGGQGLDLPVEQVLLHLHPITARIHFTSDAESGPQGAASFWLEPVLGIRIRKFLPDPDHESGSNPPKGAYY
jgi:hypothetical protein